MKLIRFFSISIVSLTLLCLFSFALRISLKSDRLGKFSLILREFSQLPRLAYHAFNEVKSPERFVKVTPGFKAVNELTSSIKYLGSQFKNDKWEIYLKDLQNDSTLYSWYLEEKDYYLTERVFSHTDPRTPILLSDSSIIINCDESNNLFRINKQSEIVWHNTDFRYHHSINPGPDGSIWTCTKETVEVPVERNKIIQYKDDCITNIDAAKGVLLYHKSIGEIFKQNDLSYYVHGFNNNSIAGGRDPFHLNDIEPVFDSSKYAEPGDLWISLRNRSMILQYNYKSERIKRIIQGPFYNQHDVDILDDSTLLLFNNNVSSLETKLNSNQEEKLNPENSLNNHAELVVYHLNDSSFSRLYQTEMADERVFTLTQGLQEMLSNDTILVESQNSGLVYVFAEGRLLYKNYIHEIRPGGQVEPPHWIRVVE